MNILEQFYFGNIQPSEISFPRTPEYKEAFQRFTASEKKLNDQLEGEQAQLFQNYCNASASIGTAQEVGVFSLGFRLGARFALAVAEYPEEKLFE